MGLAWQQGPLAAGSVGHFLTAQPLPEHLLFAEPLRRRMRVRVGDDWIADSENVLLLHEPGRYPVAYFPLDDIRDGILLAEDRITSSTSIQFGVGVSSIRHKDVDGGQWQGRFHLGADPQRADYASFADVSDPDGNTWVLQERGHRDA